MKSGADKSAVVAINRPLQPAAGVFDVYGEMSEKLAGDYGQGRRESIGYGITSDYYYGE